MYWGFSPDSAARHPKFEVPALKHSSPAVSGPRNSSCTNLGLFAERSHALRKSSKTPEKHLFFQNPIHSASIRRFFKNRCDFWVWQRFLRACKRLANSYISLRRRAPPQFCIFRSMVLFGFARGGHARLCIQTSCTGSFVHVCVSSIF